VVAHREAASRWLIKTQEVLGEALAELLLTDIPLSQLDVSTAVDCALIAVLQAVGEGRLEGKVA
jgi:hypothetical protein